MIDQFFGKTFSIALASTFFLFLLSIIAYFFGGSLFFLTAVIVILTFLTARNPTTGLMGVFLELFSSPHGQLISTEMFSFNFSLRMAVFVGFFIGYVIYLLRKKLFPNFSKNSFFPLIALFLAVAFGFLNGFLLNTTIKSFQDGNAYLFLLYAIPILSIDWTSNDKRKILQVFSAGAIWNIVLSFLILYFFTHTSESLIKMSYVFLRDIRLAEITNLGGSLYRVFIQTQFFVFAFGAFILALLVKLKTKHDILSATLLLGVIISTIIISLSRSFWIGIITALIVFIFLIFKFFRKTVKWKIFSFSLIISTFFSVLFIFAVVLFPFPTQKVGGSELTDFFSKRITSADDVAISSRWKLLQPMTQAISKHPIFGNGFGKEVGFETDDPRAREIRPDGKWSTYAMEWGWLELWLKMGLLGPIGFLIVFVYLNKCLITLLKSEQSWLAIGLITSLIFLFTAHAFSSYLNHPIGLGFILFTFIFIPKNEKELVKQISFQSSLVVQQEKPVPASAISLQVEE
ncbi:O-antigen ligase family protein [Candidatus Uhrbacteria bacterium]|nr:O-antigen ligase family protein [Candidatus Uhrbacteria bacterium]